MGRGNTTAVVSCIKSVHAIRSYCWFALGPQASNHLLGLGVPFVARIRNSPLCAFKYKSLKIVDKKQLGKKKNLINRVEFSFGISKRAY